jgi:hypothetical protein
MLGLVQSRPLLISEPIDYASTWHGRSEIVSRDPEGAIHRSNYAEVATRAKRVANARCAGGWPWGPRRDARMERLAPSRYLLWRDQLGPIPSQ